MTKILDSKQMVQECSLKGESLDNVDVSSCEPILDIIRSSAKKEVVKISTVGKPKTPRPRNPNKIVRNVDPEPYVKAVRYVKEERRKAGLPTEVKAELESIEEEAVRAELRASRDGSFNEKKQSLKYLDEYLDTKTFSRRIVTENWAERVAKELVQWVEATPGAIKLNEFFREKGIYHRDFYRIAKKHPILESAIDYALRALGDTRERKVLQNEWNSSAGMFMMGHYDEDWRAEMTRREDARLKQTIANTVDIAAIVKETIEPVSPTEEVRKKREDDARRQN